MGLCRLVGTGRRLLQGKANLAGQWNVGQERGAQGNGQGPVSLARNHPAVCQLALREEGFQFFGGNLCLTCADNVARIELRAAM